MLTYLVQFLLYSVYCSLERWKLISHGRERQVSGEREQGNVEGS